MKSDLSSPVPRGLADDRSEVRLDVPGWTVLRAVAALWVVVYHFRPHFGSDLNYWLVGKGYLAVDIFFVLSGAVMYHVYTGQISRNSIRWRDYFWRRLARLYPVHVVTMVIVAVVLYVGPKYGFGKAPPYDFGVAILVNLVALQGIGFLDRLTLNYPSWSISAELSAYLIFFLLFRICASVPKGLSWLLGAVVFVVWYLVFNELQARGLFGIVNHRPGLTHLTYDLSFLRIIPEFFLGLAAMRSWDGSDVDPLSHRTSLFIATLATLLISLALGSDLLFVLSAAALIVTVRVKSVPAPKPLIFIGKISYSLYMVHGIVEMVVFKLLERLGSWGDNAVPLWTIPIPLGVSVIAAYFMWRTVEEPGRKLLMKVKVTS